MLTHEVNDYCLGSNHEKGPLLGDLGVNEITTQAHSHTATKKQLALHPQNSQQGRAR